MNVKKDYSSAKCGGDGPEGPAPQVCEWESEIPCIQDKARGDRHTRVGFATQDASPHVLCEYYTGVSLKTV